MEFWGEEVKSGQTLSVQPGEDNVIHITQASLGETKKDKGSENIYLSVVADGKKLILGTLHSELRQQQFDLLFNKDFELSHSWKGGSVYFFGYKSLNAIELEDSDEDEKAEAKIEAAVRAAAENRKAKIAESSKDEKADDKEDTDDDEDEDDSDTEEDEDDGDEDQSDEESEETPKKAEPSKKRPADSATKTPAPEKKAKFVTPQKTDGKKGAVHVDTPHPAKQAGKSKTPGNKPNQTPNSGGSHACTTCNRTFGSDKALESHSKAKHSAGK